MRYGAETHVVESSPFKVNQLRLSKAQNWTCLIELDQSSIAYLQYHYSCSISMSERAGMNTPPGLAALQGSALPNFEAFCVGSVLQTASQNVTHGMKSQKPHLKSKSL
jgi:hypothetical protein